MNSFLYIVLTAYIALSYIGLCNGENVFNRVFRQVAETINYDKPSSNDHHVDTTTTTPWNPFNWFIPKINDIPYNPDTDLGTVSLFTSFFLLLLPFCWP